MTRLLCPGKTGLGRHSWAGWQPRRGMAGQAPFSPWCQVRLWGQFQHPHSSGKGSAEPVLCATGIPEMDREMGVGTPSRPSQRQSCGDGEAGGLIVLLPSLPCRRSSPTPPAPSDCRVRDPTALPAAPLPSWLAMALILLIKIISSGSLLGKPGLNLFSAARWAHAAPPAAPWAAQASPRLWLPCSQEVLHPQLCLAPPSLTQLPEQSRGSDHKTGGGSFPTHGSALCSPQPLTCLCHLLIFSPYL